MADEVQNQDEVEDGLRKLWRRTDSEFIGEWGIAANGRPSDAGMDKLFDAARLHGYGFVRK